MLVLSRQREESICIGPNIRITICDIRGDKVRIGIKAPDDVQIHRAEVVDKIAADKAIVAELEAVPHA